MVEPKETQNKEWHSGSRLVDFHVQITGAQLAQIRKHCSRYERSQGDFTREAISYILSFYRNLEKEHPEGGITHHEQETVQS